MNVQPLRDMLGKGLYLDNLWELARVCRSLAMDASHPLPFFVMRQVFLEIANNWDERPLPVEEATYIGSKIAKPLEDLLVGLECGASAAELFDLLDAFVSARLVALR